MITYQVSSLEELDALLSNPRLLALFIIISIWSLIWKGFALWKASRNNSKPWFIALLVVNTVGILEILYIFFFSKKKDSINSPQL